MSENLPYGKGTIKLTWINPKDYNILESAMYNSVDEALKNIPKNIKKNDFLIFELVSTDGVEYKWKLLPYGRSSQYKYGMEFFDNDFVFYGVLGLSLFGVYSVLKVLKIF
jgi:hypothetical protein